MLDCSERQKQRNNEPVERFTPFEIDVKPIPTKTKFCKYMDKKRRSMPANH